MNKRPQTLKLTMTGVFAAMITIMTAYICHVPYGANGGYIHFGDALDKAHMKSHVEEWLGLPIRKKA